MIRKLSLVGVALVAAAAFGEPLRGVVLDAFDQPVVGAVIRSQFEHEALPATTSAADGGFTIDPDWPPGAWSSLDILAYAPPKGTGVLEHDGPPDRLDKPLLLRLGPSGELSGTVVGPGAVPRAGAVVEVIGLDEPMVSFWSRMAGAWDTVEPPLARVVTDKDGSFAFGGLPLGRTIEDLARIAA